MTDRNMLFLVLTFAGLTFAGCSDKPSKSSGKDNGDAAARAKAEAAEDAHAEDLKRVVELAKEARRIKQGPETRDRIEAMHREANSIMARVTGLDPERDKKRFDREALKLLKKAAKTYDPDFYADLLKSEKQRDQVNARAMLHTIAMALHQYRLNTARYPTAEEGLQVLTKGGDRGPYLHQKLTDPWGRPFVYRPSVGGFTLFSTGPDGKEGTADDIKFE